MLKIEIRGKFNSERVAKHLTPALFRAVTKSCLLIERDAKRNAPVDQGRLRSSITHDVYQVAPAGVTGRVGTSVFYAPFVEYGTGQIGRRTAAVQGVRPPTWYVHSPQAGHYVPLDKAPGLRRWLELKAGYKLEPTGKGGYDIYYKGTNTILRRNARWWYVSGRAQPFLTPALLRNQMRIIQEIKKAVRQGLKEHAKG